MKTRIQQLLQETKKLDRPLKELTRSQRRYITRKGVVDMEEKCEIDQLGIGQKNIFLVATIKSVYPEHTLPNSNIQATDVILEDKTGECTLNVFDRAVEDFKSNVGKQVSLEGAYCKGEYEGRKKLTLGKFGKYRIQENVGGDDEGKKR